METNLVKEVKEDIQESVHEFVSRLNNMFPGGKTACKGKGKPFTYLDVLNYAKKGNIPLDYGGGKITKVGRGKESIIQASITRMIPVS